MVESIYPVNFKGIHNKLSVVLQALPRHKKVDNKMYRVVSPRISLLYR